ncbi:MAG: hypothetical protein ACRDEA_21940, partial [Microcystaceae cyanobacterium]
MQALSIQAGPDVAIFQPLPREHLFLSFRIYREGRVEVFPSFHYLSLPTLRKGESTPYGIELRDRFNRVLQSQRVWLTDPYRDLDSAFIDFYKPIPFDPKTAKVVFTCHAGNCQGKELLSVKVSPKPPQIRFVSSQKSNQSS